MTRKDLKLIIKECIEEIRDDNEIVSEGFFNKRKKKTTTTKQPIPNMTSEEKQEMYKDFDELVSIIKKIISKMKNTSEFKKVCKDCCLDFFEVYDGYDEIVDNDKFIPKLSVDVFQSISENQEGIITILDYYQEVQDSFKPVLKMIIEYIEKDYSELHSKFKFYCNNGCIYVNRK